VGQQGTRQPAGARANFNRGAMREVAGLARDPSRQVEIEQKMLTQGMARAEPVAGDDVA